MIDRATFRRLNSNYALPQPVPPKVDENIHIPGFGQQYDPYGNPIPEPLPSINNPGITFQKDKSTLPLLTFHYDSGSSCSSPVK